MSEINEESSTLLQQDFKPKLDAWEGSMRPRSLHEYLGQERVKRQITLALQAARERQEALDHCLLAGPPGLGKTTLAQLIAKEFGSELHTVTGPHLEKKGDVAAVLTSLNPTDVLFIDEIHRIPKTIEEVLYSAMEDFRLDIILGQGPGARPLKIDLVPFTLVGATTRLGLLSNPLRDRFGVHLRLDYYTIEELTKILARSAALLKLSFDLPALYAMAKRSRGTPRIANRLLRRVRDFMQIHARSYHLTQPMAEEALHLLEVDERGLEPLDRKYLDTLQNLFKGGPAGIETLASAMGEERGTLEEVIEPYLLQQGLIQKTPRGRIMSLNA